MLDINHNRINRLVATSLTFAKKALFLCIIANAIFWTNTSHARAGVFSGIFNKVLVILNVQTVGPSISTTTEDQDYIIKANTKNIVVKNSTSTRSKILSADGTIVVAVGPVRATTEEEVMGSDKIEVYEVKKGDTLADIAKLYSVSKNTIVWANDIKGNKVTPGDVLIILPVSGVKHTIKKGDTIKSIAKKYKAEETDILEFNNIHTDELAVGDEIVIPDGEIYSDAPVKKNSPVKPVKRKIYASAGAGYYVRPIIGGTRTQGLHGHNGIDIAAPVGGTLLAAAAGTVQVAKQGGYNGGYGSMVIISHPNGTQTLYAHMSSVYVSTGQSVSQGEQIGTSGNSGKSTGPHLHFEVRGAANPF